MPRLGNGDVHHTSNGPDSIDKTGDHDELVKKNTEVLLIVMSYLVVSPTS